MAYSEELAMRIRKAMRRRKDYGEIKMFGGVCFTLGGHMTVGVVDDELMARVGPENYESALKVRHARPMDFTGKPMRGYVYVAAKGITRDDDLKKWISRAASFVNTLPPKKSKPKSKNRPQRK